MPKKKIGISNGMNSKHHKVKRETSGQRLISDVTMGGSKHSLNIVGIDVGGN